MEFFQEQINSKMLGNMIEKHQFKKLILDPDYKEYTLS